MGVQKNSIQPEDASSSDTDVSTDSSDSVSDTEDDTHSEEDEILKRIRKENEKQNNHPPSIEGTSFITDISFHPDQDILAVGNIEGDVTLFKYSNEGNIILDTLELHTEACRGIDFDLNGKRLFSISKDKCIMLSDVTGGKLFRFYDNAHDVPPYCIKSLDEHLFATGDDDGVVKLWDLRVNTDKSIFMLKKNEDYISDIVTNESLQYLLCASGDGCLTTIDLRQRQFFMQSEEQEEELTCLGLFRSETKVLAGSSKGKLLFFNWNEFGLHSDIFPTTKTAITCLVPITENIVVTGHEDGHLRAIHLFPHKHLGVVGQHTLSIENLDICNNGKFIASTSHNNDIKFWNISYFEEFEEVTHKRANKAKRKEEFNLPSSKRTNTADFFSDLR
ncbi:hypothetical protein PPYR_08939 [Photinus pyralis]|uniref:WD repeat-containing protein 55 homolog n=1 Tax=Photinus pyralis TaxID=7054 RepID=A0A1Y1LG13_PHOPY|nr:WD repeat-containing protein 55 homolog [Photinus pyralis]XP_031342821.1 WD repeat-containing protein 55 homolog [Photinus pyralis]KAB0797946.1 hypothetical protein PPYR_08939 [Photinus pyralis]